MNVEDSVNPPLHRNPKGNLRKEGDTMNIIDIMTMLSFGLTCFGIGYSIGKDINKTQK